MNANQFKAIVDMACRDDAILARKARHYEWQRVKTTGPRGTLDRALAHMANGHWRGLRHLHGFYQDVMVPLDYYETTRIKFNVQVSADLVDSIMSAIKFYQSFAQAWDRRQVTP